MTEDPASHMPASALWRQVRRLKYCVLGLLVSATACTIGSEDLLPATVSDDARLPAIPYGAIWLLAYPQDLDQLVLIESDALDNETRSWCDKSPVERPSPRPLAALASLIQRI